eukprot:MONOS_7968.1-p1 / transcript=MONOS_7968.1 / gene=MONOS_7968 / organism=Monocercomonoides_exilis_PA203 / gene_product=unspecified product / transcript_product=unspecified product / location=Mono_scaffold00288:15353-16888(+) / protein_length=459 / sequence_SO=supercontig / SO=protein_coding / is_pseudo=false
MWLLKLCLVVEFILSDDDTVTYYVHYKKGVNSEDCGTKEKPCLELQYLIKKTSNDLKRNISLEPFTYYIDKMDILKGEVTVFNSKETDQNCCLENDKGEKMSEAHQVITADTSNVTIRNVHFTDLSNYDKKHLKDTEVCNWNHACFELNNCTTEIHDSDISSTLGALFMNQGTLKLSNVEFSSSIVESVYNSRRPLTCIGDGLVNASGTYEKFGSDEKGNFFDLRKCRAAGTSLTEDREPFFTPVIKSVSSAEFVSGDIYSLTIFVLHYLPCELMFCANGTDNELRKLAITPVNSSYVRVEIHENDFPARFNATFEYPATSKAYKQSRPFVVDMDDLLFRKRSSDNRHRLTPGGIIAIVVVVVLLALSVVTVVTVICIVTRRRKRNSAFVGASLAPMMGQPAVGGGYDKNAYAYQGYAATAAAQPALYQPSKMQTNQMASSEAEIKLPESVELGKSVY